MFLCSLEHGPCLLSAREDALRSKTFCFTFLTNFALVRPACCFALFGFVFCGVWFLCCFVCLLMRWPYQIIDRWFLSTVPCHCIQTTAIIVMMSAAWDQRTLLLLDFWCYLMLLESTIGWLYDNLTLLWLDSIITWLYCYMPLLLLCR